MTRWLSLGWLLAAFIGWQSHAECADKDVAPLTPAALEKLTPLNPQGTVLLDKPGHRLVLKGEICLRDGLLEMLVCLKRTKEHEAIFAVDTKAQIVHAGLIALGVEPGRPVQFQPDYKPATGPVIDVFISWTDEDKKPHRVKAQTLVRNSIRRYWVEKLEKIPAGLKAPPDSELRVDEKRSELLWYGAMSDAQRDEMLKLSKDAAYQKAIKSFYQQTRVSELKADWVFGGSGFYVDPKTGDKFYQAEEGNLICVANFSSATIDLAVPSSATNDDLMYEAFTERIPSIGTPVVIELVPRKTEAPAGAKLKPAK
ncbi:MAG TPA: YdjY domain-containing protein [Planctomycetaceae bacterium]|nr:YdjY domain-containing protein [Planctomycetaceae bacterium]